jgi:hypothetical protein
MFREENKNVSLPKFLNNRFLASQNVFPVYDAPKPNYDVVTQFIIREDTPAFNEQDGWIINWIVNDKTQDQIDNDTNVKATEVRKIRDKLLSDCDWVTIRATDLGTAVSEDWAAYRQSLRDVSNQETFPWNVIWPTDPTGFTYGEITSPLDNL